MKDFGMKTAAFVIALMVSGAALAQADTYAANPTAYEGDGAATAAWETEGAPAGAYAAADLTGAPIAMPAAAGAVVEPSNANPERDARGIPVISDPATVPSGFNGTTGAGVGGPMVDPATGATVTGADASYPACTRTVTDNCVQTYERGRRH
jgi:hypothetical protein